MRLRQGEITSVWGEMIIFFGSCDGTSQEEYVYTVPRFDPRQCQYPRVKSVSSGDCAEDIGWTGGSHDRGSCLSDMLVFVPDSRV